jgi:pyrroloquinoline-quinone synthase
MSTATQDLTAALDAIIAERSLLKHPFYQAWTKGTLPLEKMREYAKQYFHFEAAFPTFLSALHSRCESPAVRQSILENLWDEEYGPDNHVALWLRFCEGLGLNEAEVRASRPNAETQALVDGFRSACFTGPVAEGLAALYAYESQAPEIARQKIAGLARNYGIRDERTLSFFKVHQEADVAHSGAEREAIAACVRTESEREGVEEAARIAADRLWLFLDGAYRDGAAHV